MGTRTAGYIQHLAGETPVPTISLTPQIYSKLFRIFSDASNVGLRTILVQNIDGKVWLICPASHSFNWAAHNYSRTKKDCLAVVWGCRTFRHFLMGQLFVVLTDGS